VSVARPNCSICLSPQLKAIDALIRQGTGLSRIMESPERARSLIVPDVSTIKLHKRMCLGITGKTVLGVDKPSEYVEPDDVDLGLGSPPPILVSAEELADPKRRLDMLREALAARIGDLSADKLYQMYMAELKLQTAQAERDAKVVPAAPDVPDDDGLDQAMAQAAGHLPDLRLVGGRHAKIARR
jgi:hypothetical protein